MSLRTALQQCFENEPTKIFGIQDLCNSVEKYYSFSEFQRQLDPQYPQPRYEHEIRSLVAKLKKDKVIEHIKHNQYRLK